MKSFVPGSVHLSSAPRFSEVMSARVVRKPFQRVLQSGCKPLKRFARSLVADTRLKPGANEREAFAVAQPEARAKLQRTTNSGFFRVFASSRLCVKRGLNLRPFRGQRTAHFCSCLARRCW